MNKHAQEHVLHKYGYKGNGIAGAALQAFFSLRFYLSFRKKKSQQWKKKAPWHPWSTMKSSLTVLSLPVRAQPSLLGLRYTYPFIKSPPACTIMHCTLYNSVFQSILGEEKLCSTNQQTFSGSLSVFGGWITCNDNYRLLLKDAEQP